MKFESTASMVRRWIYNEGEVNEDRKEGKKRCSILKDVEHGTTESGRNLIPQLYLVNSSCGEWCVRATSAISK